MGYNNWGLESLVRPENYQACVIGTMVDRWAALTSALVLGLLLALTSARRGDRYRYKTAYACEGRQLHISCDEGYLIHLVRANYGRFSISVCNEHGSLDWSVDCTSPRSYYVIHESCTMRNSCTVLAENTTFDDDPCPGTYKYLEAHYYCVAESVTTTSSSTTPSTTTTTTTTTRPPIIIPLTRYQRPTPHSVFTSSLAVSTTTTPPPVTWPVTIVADQAAETQQPSLPPSPETQSPVLYHQPVSTSSTTEAAVWRPELTTQDSFLKDEGYCPPAQFRNLSWDWTKAGSVAVQKCPGGTVGIAKWRCGIAPVRWIPDTPDLSQCSSLWADNMRTRVDGEHDSVVTIAAELAVVTHNKPLYGGDVRHASEIVQRLITKMADKVQEISDDKQRHQVLQELLESVVDVTNNLLEASQKASWGDLPAGERRHVASILLESLEHSGWLLASGQRASYYFRRADSNVLFSVRVVEAWAASEVKFPSFQDVNGTAWSNIEDYVRLPTQALLASNGVVKMVFTAYNRVEDFLGTVSSSRRGILHNSSHIINSRVIAASTGRYPVVKLAEPVTVVFRLIQQENVTNPQCVFWDLDTRLWSQEGCWLKTSNKTHAVCACNHLTNFALLMEVRASENTSQNKLLSKIAVFVSCGIAMLLFALTIILLQIFRSFPNDHSTIHKHLSVCLLLAEAIYVAGANQMDRTVVCSLLAGALHLVLQAAFVWLFLAAFQLYVLLLGPSHTGRTRVRCYCLVAYGMSAVIVAVAAVIDPRSYGTSNYCWLRVDNYYVFSFVGPAVACILGAVMFLGLTVCRTCWFSTKSSSAKNKELVKANTAKIRSREAWFVVLSTSASWTFLLLYLDQRTPSLAYLFTTLNCLQGLAVFICFGLRNDEVRQAYRKWLDRGNNGGGSQQPQPKSGGRQPGQFVLPATSSLHSLQHLSWNSTRDPQLPVITSTIPTCVTPGPQSIATRSNWSRENVQQQDPYLWQSGWRGENERDLAFLDLLCSSRQSHMDGRLSAEHIYECIDDTTADTSHDLSLTPRGHRVYPWGHRHSRQRFARWDPRDLDAASSSSSVRIPKIMADITHPDIIQNGGAIPLDNEWTEMASEDFSSAHGTGDGSDEEPTPCTPTLRIWGGFSSALFSQMLKLPGCDGIEDAQANIQHSSS